MTRNSRPGYTLLEMILAMAIGLVIMSALYVTLASHLKTAQSSRDRIEEGTLARFVLTRITNDVMCQLGAVDPKILPEAGPTEAPAAESSTTTTEGSETAKPAPASSSTAMVEQSAGTFNLGVVGNASRLTLYVSRVPRELNMTGGLGKVDLQPEALAPDLRRITFWMSDKGLCRQEVKMITGEEIDNMPDDSAETGPYLLAPEVKGLELQYYDANEGGWSDTWDGSITSLEGDVPRGPPAAIAVTIMLHEKAASPDEPPREKRYRHVIAIPAGNNYPQGGMTSP